MRSRVFWIGILSFLAIAVIYYFLFFSGFFKIKKIIITGDQIISEEIARTFVARNNIFLINAAKIEKDILSGFSQIAKVKISRSFPSTLNISIIKREPAAVWCDLEKCFLTDNDGVNFREAPTETDLIKITGAKELVGRESISQILRIQKELKDKSIATTTRAFIVSEERLNIKTSEGWEAYFNLKGNLDWQLQELNLVLEKQISPEKRRNLEYVDLRFSRVYYK